MTVSDGMGKGGLPESDDCFPPYTVTGYEVNVLDYGAVGDGKADDTEAVQTALSEAKKNNGTIYFPKGIYRLTKQISFTSNCLLAFAEGAMLEATASVRISTMIYAGNHQIFGGSGKYRLTAKNACCNPVWFGAKGDGRTDDTEAFEAALESASAICIPYSEQGYVLGDLRLDRSVKISGLPSADGKRPLLIGKPDSENLFVLAADTIVLERFDVDMSEAGRAAVFFYDTSKSGRDDYRLSDIDVTGAYCVIRDAGVANHYVTNSLTENVNCYSSRGTSFDLKCFWGFVFFRDLVIDNSQTEARYGIRPDFPAVVLQNNAGCIFQRMKIIGDGNVANTQAHGFRYVNDVATWMDECSFENITGQCVRTEGASSHLYFSNLTTTGGTSDAFVFSAVSFLQLHRLTVDGSKGVGSAVGILLKGCQAVQITGCRLERTAGSAVTVTGCRGTSIVECEIRSAGSVGVAEAASQGTAIVGCRFEEGKGEDYTIGGQSGIC